MKKIVFIILLALILIFLSLVYILIPKKISVVTTRFSNCTLNGAERMILYTNKWAAWWPGTIERQADSNNLPSFIFKNHIYKPGIVALDNIEVSIIYNDVLTKTELVIVPTSKDLVELNWLSEEIITSKNPLERIKQYLRAGKVKNDLDSLLTKLRSFLENKENIYGVNVNEVRVKDSVLITTRFTTSLYPSTTEIYSAVNKLRKYITEQNAISNNFPMMHVDQIDSIHYETMIAIPVNKALQATDNMVAKRMVLGNILEAEIKGGEATVRKGMEQLENYKKDHDMESPAIPFALLVTDRSKEPDSTKWITRIYYPVY